MKKGWKVYVYERKGFLNSLLWGEPCYVTKVYGNGCYQVWGSYTNVLESVYADEMKESKSLESSFLP